MKREREGKKNKRRREMGEGGMKPGGREQEKRGKEE